MTDTEITQVLAAGSHSSFWKTLRNELYRVKAEAVEDLIQAPPEEIGKIAELQQMARVIDRIVALVDTAPAELKITEQE